MNQHRYGMNMARAAAAESKDPSSKVGCVILDELNRPVGSGYNGWVAGCDEDHMSFTDKPMKYETVVHAEMNALLFATRQDLRGCKLYTTHSPCSNCLKHILQKGIREIYYEDSSIMRRTAKLPNEAVLKLMAATGAKVMHINGVTSYDFEIFDHLTKEQK